MTLRDAEGDDDARRRDGAGAELPLDVHVAVVGTVDRSTSPQLERHLSALDPAADHVLDLAGAAFLDLSGVCAIAHLAERCAGAGGHVIVRRAAPVIQRILDCLDSRFHGALVVDPTAEPRGSTERRPTERRPTER